MCPPPIDTTTPTYPSEAQERSTVRWYVMRAYKKERQAEEALSGPEGLEFFIPKRYALRTYHGHKQRQLVPAIPSLVFVHASRNDIQAFKLRHPLLQYIMWNKSTGLEFLTVPDRQMAHFIRVAQQTEEDILYFQPDEIQLHKGAHVRVHGGPFDGVEGILLKVKGHRRRRVVIQIDQVATIAAAEIEPDLIEVLPD